MATNESLAAIEDAIVERLDADPVLAGRVFPVVDPIADVTAFPAPPIVLVVATGLDLADESQALGQTLRRKFTVTIEIVFVAAYLRARGEMPGIHDLCAVVHDRLFGWTPTVDGVQRPLVLVSSNVYDQDEERRLAFWLESWATMIIVREP